MTLLLHMHFRIGLASILIYAFAACFQDVFPSLALCKAYFAGFRIGLSGCRRMDFLLFELAEQYFGT